MADLSDLHSELRGRILTLAPRSIGIVPSQEAPNVWGVLVEMGHPEGVITLISLANGTTNLLSGGGGAVGAHKYPAVAEAAKRLVAHAEQFLGKVASTNSFPLPQVGRVRFYILTFSDAFTAEAEENLLGEGQHELAPLFASAQEVITQVRQQNEQRKNAASQPSSPPLPATSPMPKEAIPECIKPIFEKLNAIDWANLKHAYGSAADTPQVIRNMVSSSQKVREAAYDTLMNTIYHQGSVYEAAIYAIPFLIELLQEPQVEGKDSILHILHLLYRGGSWHANHQDMQLLRDQRDTPEFQAEMRVEMEWVDRIRHAVKAGIPVYLSVAAVGDLGTRLQAISLLSALGDPAQQVAPQLVAMLRAEDNPVMQACLIIGLACLGGDDQLGLFEELYQQTRDPLVQLVTAMCIARIKQEETPADVEAVLFQQLRQPDSAIVEAYEQLPMSCDLLTDVGLIIIFLSPEKADGALALILNNTTASRYDALYRVRALLALAFRGSNFQAPAPEHLTPLQREAIAFAAQQTWQEKWVDVDMLDVLAHFGLPSRDQEQMRWYLGAAKEEEQRPSAKGIIARLMKKS